VRGGAGHRAVLGVGREWVMMDLIFDGEVGVGAAGLVVGGQPGSVGVIGRCRGWEGGL